MSFGRRRWATIGPWTPRSESLTAIFSGQVRPRGPSTCMAAQRAPQAVRGPTATTEMQVLLHPQTADSALASRLQGAKNARTHVRRPSVRTRSYLTNTCSHHCGHHHLPSGRSARWTWPARSSCSRTTTPSTGRSTGTSHLSRSIRTECPCAGGQRGVGRAFRRLSSSFASPLFPTVGPSGKGLPGLRARRMVLRAVARTLRGSTGRTGARRRARPA
jgi:hypothetical protein